MKFMEKKTNSTLQNSLFQSVGFVFFATTFMNVISWWNFARTQNICHCLQKKYFGIFLNCFWIFWDFSIHAKIIWARTQMGNFQHFFHDCKWHAHIGDVFLNILISYLHFFELVWICSEVFKVAVKRSKGKSISSQSGLDKTGVFLKLGANQTSGT